MKSIKLIVLSALFFCAANLLFAAPPDTPETLYAKIAALFEDGHADKVEPFMTKEAHAAYVKGSIEGAAEGYLWKEKAPKLLPDGTKASGADIGFDTLKFPKWFADPNGIPAPGDDLPGLRKKLYELMKTVPNRQRALNSLYAFEQTVYPGNIFSGKIIEKPEIHEEKAGVIWVFIKDEFAEYEFPLKFEKQKDETLLYAGIDNDLIRAGEKKARLALRKDLTIAGKNVDGKDISLKDLEGKVVLVDFWGTWCVPCIAAFPHLKKIKEAYKSEPFEILGVAGDRKKDLKKFFTKKGELPWPNLLDPTGDVANRLNVDAFPTYFLVDKTGKHIAVPQGKEGLGDLIAKALGIDPIPLK